jgi:phosphohistidine phosphatase
MLRQVEQLHTTIRTRELVRWRCPNREPVASRREARRGFGEPIPPRRLLVRPGDTGSRSGQHQYIGQPRCDLNGYLCRPRISPSTSSGQTWVMHRLFILRHAKAATHPPTAGGGDHERRLAPRGIAVLPGVARAIVRQLDGHQLDLVLCSPSARTRETVGAIVEAEPLIGGARLKLENKLYLADPDRLFKVLRKVPADAQAVLICGHNPGLHELALALIGSDATPERLRYDLPTAGLVVLDLEGGWTSTGAGPAAATLRAFIVPSAD